MVRELSVAAATMLVLVIRLPYFGLVWYLCQWLFAVVLLMRLGCYALGSICRLATPDGDDADADEEKVPLWQDGEEEHQIEVR